MSKRTPARVVAAAVLSLVVLASCTEGRRKVDFADPEVTTSTAAEQLTAPTTTVAAPTSTVAPSTTPSTGVATAPTLATAGPGTTAGPAAPAPAPTCPAIPPRASPREDRSRYVVTANVDVAGGTVAGTTEVKFTPDLATDRIVLRLWPNGPQLAAAGANLDAGTVSVDSQAVPVTRPDPTTLVAAYPVRAGETVTVSLSWSLTVARSSSLRTTKVGDSIRLGSFFPLLPWEPGRGWALDPPTQVHGEDSTAPTADFDLTVTVPPGYDVVATGTQDRPGHWTAPAVADLGVAVGRFRTATATANGPNPVKITVVADAGVSESPAPYAAKAAKVIEQFSRRFGPYRWPSYTLAITANLIGGIEYPMFVHTGQGAIGRSTSHEIAHQYFYGLVGNDQGRDPWIDEGLASWAEVGFEGTLAAFRSRPIPAAARSRLGESTPFWERISDSYYTGVYVQGVQALDALGPQDKIDCALARYVARNAYRVARPADVVAALTEVFPNAPSVLARYGVRP